jgi:hypothetical protein
MEKKSRENGKEESEKEEGEESITRCNGSGVPG